jgi:hypothetical protein
MHAGYGVRMGRELDLSSYSSEPIEIEIGGTTYSGIRFVTGTGQVRQEVHFEDLWQIDPKLHRARAVAEMRRTARVILRDLVEQWKTRAARRPLKVGPRASSQRRRMAR